MEKNDPIQLEKDLVFFQEQLNQKLSKFQRQVMLKGHDEARRQLIRYWQYDLSQGRVDEDPDSDVVTFKHQNLASVRTRLANLIELRDHDLEKFIEESANFIAEGMDYICNVQLPKKSCDVIYQYQVLLRSDLFVAERQEILERLLPKIKLLKDTKFSMLPHFPWDHI